MIESNKLAGIIGVVLVIFTASPNFAQTTAKTINVTSLQAVGDGKTDDTEAIQEAILQASAGDTVFIPDGVYLVTSLGLKSGVHIKSDGLLVQKAEGE